MSTAATAPEPAGQPSGGPGGRGRRGERPVRPGTRPDAGLRAAVRRGGPVAADDVPAAREAARSLTSRRLAAWPLAALPLCGLVLLAAADGLLPIVLGAVLVLGGAAAVVLLARDAARGRAFLDAHPEPATVRDWLRGCQGDRADREAGAAALRRRWLVAAVLLVLVAPAVLVPLVPPAPDALPPAPPPTWRALTGAALGVGGAVVLVLAGLAAWRGGQVDRWWRSPLWGLPADRRRRLLLRLRGLEPTPEVARPQVRALAAHLARQGPTVALLVGLVITLLGRGVGSASTTTLALSLVAVATVTGLLVALLRASGQARRFLRAGTGDTGDTGGTAGTAGSPARRSSPSP